MKNLRLKTKFVIMFAIFCCVVLAAIGATISIGYKQDILGDYAGWTNDIGALVVSKLDGDRLVEYASSLQTDEDYYAVREELTAIKESITNVRYLYVMVPDAETLEEAVYIYDIYTQAEYDAGNVDEGTLGFIETLTDEDFGSAKEVFIRGERISSLDVTNTEYGFLASVYAPVFDSNGKTVALVGVDVDMTKMESYMRSFTINIMVLVCCIILVCCAALLMIVQKQILNPVHEIEKKVGEFAASDHEESAVQYHIALQSKDELGVMGRSINRMMDDIENYISNLATVTAEKERIGAELDIAANIQASMLPCIFPPFPDREEFDIRATMTPAKEVGGDFYDFFMVDDRHLAIVMADVSGKGVPAALFMVIGKTLIKDHTQPGRDLGEVFSEVNELLCESNSEGLFITAFEGVLDLVSGEFNYVNAGHEMPFICRAGGEFAPHKIRPGFVLAGTEGIFYRAGSTTLAPGDQVFLFTDGVTEATNSSNELYGRERLSKILNEVKDESLDEILAGVKRDIDAFVKEAPQFDDITMLCMKMIAYSKEKTGSDHRVGR